MSSARESGGWQGWLALALAVFLLNLGLSFHNVWPTLWVETRHELSLEVAVLVAALALYAELFRPPPAQLARWLALLLTLLVLGRYAQVTAPALYGRPINLYWDTQHVPAVLAMLARVAPVWLVVLVGLGAAALLAAVYWVVRWVLGRTLLALEYAPQRRALGLVAGGVLAFYVGGQTSAHIDSRGWFSIPVTATYARQAGFLWEALGGADAQGLAADPLPASDLGALGGGDVFVVFLESYGAIAYDRPEYAKALQGSREAFGAALAGSGRQVVSAYVESPTFAGGSWRAHASLLSGMEVRDDRRYSLLLTQERETLVHRFKAAGYRPVALMPGLRRDWPEGRYYDFETLYGEQRLDYQGPEFGWWRLPDQYALARLDQLEVATAGPRNPLFLFFPTISTHLPFRPTPPYQPDWQQLLSEEPYAGTELNASLARTPDWTALGPAYVDALGYAFAYLGGYLEQRAPADLTLVVIGDHQPAANVSGERASWEVPVHVISNRQGVLEALLAEGFQPGMTPRRPALGRMDQLTGTLLGAFASGSYGAVAALRRLESGVNVAGARAFGDLGNEGADGGSVDPVGGGEAMRLAH